MADLSAPIGPVVAFPPDFTKVREDVRTYHLETRQEADLAQLGVLQKQT